MLLNPSITVYSFKKFLVILKYAPQFLLLLSGSRKLISTNSTSRGLCPLALGSIYP